MGVLDWLNSMKHGKKSQAEGQQATSEPTAKEPNESSIENYLRSGQASPSFTLLANDVKDKVVAKVMSMPRNVQADVLTRMQSMPLDELIEFGTGKKTPAKLAAKRNYTVSQGDSLSKIAKAHKITVKDLVAANPQIDNPDLIYPKQVINLPAHAGD